MKMGIVNMKRFGNRMLIEVETMSVIFPLLRWFCINVGGAGVEPFDLPVLHLYILEKLNDCLLESRMHKYMETWHKPKLIGLQRARGGLGLWALFIDPNCSSCKSQWTNYPCIYQVCRRLPLDKYDFRSDDSNKKILNSIVDIWSIVIFSRIIFSAELRKEAVRITVMNSHPANCTT